MKPRKVPGGQWIDWRGPLMPLVVYCLLLLVPSLSAATEEFPVRVGTSPTTGNATVLYTEINNTAFQDYRVESIQVVDRSLFVDDVQIRLASIPSQPINPQSEIDIGQKYIRQMIMYAKTEGGISNEEDILAVKGRIEALNIRSRFGQRLRKQARQYNERGLKYLQDGELTEAVQAFQIAYQADPADIEIIDNLGYVHLRRGDLGAAEPLLLRALVFAPGRSSAWANLGQIYAKQGDSRAATACFANAYRFSRDQDATRQFLQKLTQDNDDKVVDAAKLTLQLQLMQVSAVQEQGIAGNPGVMTGTAKEMKPNIAMAPEKTPREGDTGKAQSSTRTTEKHIIPTEKDFKKTNFVVFVLDQDFDKEPGHGKVALSLVKKFLRVIL